MLAGFEEHILDAMLGIQCPNILYPYATAAVSQLITSGGFRRSRCSRSTSRGLYGETLRQRQAQLRGEAPMAWPMRKPPATPDARLHDAVHAPVGRRPRRGLLGALALAR